MGKPFLLSPQEKWQQLLNYLPVCRKNFSLRFEIKTFKMILVQLLVPCNFQNNPSSCQRLLEEFAEMLFVSFGDEAYFHFWESVIK